VRCAEETLRRAALRGLAQKVQSGVREQGRYAACIAGSGVVGPTSEKLERHAHEVGEP
jgi:hypothetical protein